MQCFNVIIGIKFDETFDGIKEVGVEMSVRVNTRHCKFPGNVNNLI